MVSNLTAAGSPLTLPLLAEVLIMWFVPNFFFGWKLGYGGWGLQTFNKINGQYTSVYIAFGGSVAWVLIVNYWLYPTVSNMIEGFFRAINPSIHPLAAFVMFIIAFVAFKRQRWA